MRSPRRLLLLAPTPPRRGSQGGSARWKKRATILSSRPDQEERIPSHGADVGMIRSDGLHGAAHDLKNNTIKREQ